LIASEADDRRVRAGRYGLLCGYFYPEADLEDLALVADWTTWEFTLDDMFSEAGLARNLARQALDRVPPGRVPSRG